LFRIPGNRRKAFALNDKNFPNLDFFRACPMSIDLDHPKKARAASLMRRLMIIQDSGGTLGDWNDAFAAVIADVSGRVGTRFGASEQHWVGSAAASAVRTVFKHVQDDAAKETTLALQPTGPDALLGLLVLIAFDKVYEKKRRDVDDQAPIIPTVQQEGRQQHVLVSEAIRDEMDWQLQVLLNRLRLLGGGQEALVYKLLLEKEFGIRDLDYEDIPGETGASAYSVKKARKALAEYLDGLKAEARRAVDNVARRLHDGS
jgi:hypothetical protein